ncbi:uncharacterized protein AMSG_00215 [Thecamonas trahens ATCC 50062]|uniref:BTB domain-containing protein n=1 Tax=Thecamonas trahens ATCC 50062 TaxID=461836 RepID=A0A0L0D482_THETB|nr:hypothetical protein AMSG_00215 [Thecamonas trahens ATCC 50062]KNC46098.1 hypothetical protein AMSG_00215 [Thecamonas trahens ATCC 50062]|eukprot:XP_013763076.1 hypothetical protein AMSG_00215 [Thecamonas trahens ATCC 50062]
MAKKYDDLLFGDLDAAAATSATSPGSLTDIANTLESVTANATGAPKAAPAAASETDARATELAADVPVVSEARRKKRRRARTLTKAETELKEAQARGTLLAPIDASLLYDIGPASASEAANAQGLSASLFSMAQAGVLCDATLVVSGVDELEAATPETPVVELTVHRAVLAAVSTAFRSAFDSDAGGADCRLPVAGFDVELFAAMIEFVYLGCVRVFVEARSDGKRPESVLIDLLRIGMRFRIVQLVAAVATETIKRVCVSNCVELLLAARSMLLGDDEVPGARYLCALANVCLHTIRINLDAFAGKQLLPLCLEDLVAILGSSDVSVSSEAVVVDVAFAWMKATKKRFKHKDVVLNLIRYYALTEDELLATRGMLNKAMNASIIDVQLAAVAGGDMAAPPRRHYVHAKTCMPTHELRGSGAPLFCVSLADSRIFVSGAADGTVSVWSVKGWKRLKVMEGHKGPVRGAVVCGTTLYSVSHDRSIRGWDVVAWEPTTSLFSAHQAPIWSVAEYDLMLVTGDASGVIKVWQEDDGVDIFNGGVTGTGLSQIATLKDHTGGIVAMATSDASLYSASDDATVRIWNIMNQTCLKVLSIGSTPLTTIAASPLMVAAAYVDGSVHVWRKNKAGPGTAKDDPAGTGGAASMRSFDIAASDSGRTVRALLFIDDLETDTPSRYVLTGATDGVIKVWDVCPDSGHQAAPSFSDAEQHVDADVDASRSSASTTADPNDADSSNGPVDAVLVRILDVHAQSVNGLVGSGSGFFVSASSDGTARVWE